jgi:hypothetical protein
VSQEVGYRAMPHASTKHAQPYKQDTRSASEYPEAALSLQHPFRCLSKVLAQFWGIEP